MYFLTVLDTKSPRSKHHQNGLLVPPYSVPLRAFLLVVCTGFLPVSCFSHENSIPISEASLTCWTSPPPLFSFSKHSRIEYCDGIIKRKKKSLFVGHSDQFISKRGPFLTLLKCCKLPEWESVICRQVTWKCRQERLPVHSALPITLTRDISYCINA